MNKRTQADKKKVLGEGAIVSHMEKVNRIFYFVIWKKWTSIVSPVKAKIAHVL